MIKVRLDVPIMMKGQECSGKFPEEMIVGDSNIIFEKSNRGYINC